MENDYSQEEISNICKDLLFDQGSKLKEEEVVFINKMYHKNLNERTSQEQRDVLISMYDRMGEANY